MYNSNPIIAQGLFEATAATGRGRSVSAKQDGAASALRPIAQVEPGSYLGLALKSLGAGLGERDGGGSPSSSDDESPPRRPQGARRRGASSDGDSSDGERARHHRAPVLKPKEPAMYDGTPDVQLYHKFVRQMSEYIEGYELPERRHASTIANYLEGRAYEFYATTVASSRVIWTMKDICIGIFNYCFPVDFRSKMREKLQRCHQRDKTVREYIHELETLFLPAGMTAERDRVDKLWKGFSGYIQKGLKPRS